MKSKGTPIKACGRCLSINHEDHCPNRKQFEPHAYAKQTQWRSTVYLPVIIIGRTKCPDHWCDGEDCEFSPTYLVMDAEGELFDIEQRNLFMFDSLQGL